MVDDGAGDGIRTHGPLQDKALNLAPLARLGYPCLDWENMAVVIKSSDAWGINTASMLMINRQERESD